MPGTTVSVVNAYDATFDFAFVNLFRIVDLPTLGRPMRTTVASPPFLISKAGPPLFEVELSSSALIRASLAFNMPICCSVCLLIWVLLISSSICLIFSGRPITNRLDQSLLGFNAHCEPYSPSVRRPITIDSIRTMTSYPMSPCQNNVRRRNCGKLTHQYSSRDAKPLSLNAGFFHPYGK